jgi:hypothetical protein
VYEAWLKAGGDPELVRELIRDWLTANANFLFQEWLKNGGEPAVITDSLQRWMRVHGENPSAKYVRRAWAKAGDAVTNGLA